MVVFLPMFWQLESVKPYVLLYCTDGCDEMDNYNDELSLPGLVGLWKVLSRVGMKLSRSRTLIYVAWAYFYTHKG